MFLGIFDIISVPLGFVLYLIEWLTSSYGLSIIIFAVLAKLLMLPSSIKMQKNQVRMKELQPKMKQLANKYHNDTRNPKYQQELQDLYTREGYNPMSGCLPTLIQFPLIFALWDIIRQPLTYVCNAGKNLADAVDIILKKGDLSNPAVQRLSDLMKANEGKSAEEIEKVLDMNEILVADAINANPGLDGLQEALLHPRTLIDTHFFGIDLNASASAQDGFWSWYLLIPVLAALSSFLVSYISMKINQSGSDPTGRSMSVMMYMMPLLSLWIGYSMNFGVAIYWISTNLLSLLQTILLPRVIAARERKNAPPEEVKEKKLNYTQIEKMERDRLSADSDD